MTTHGTEAGRPAAGVSTVREPRSPSLGQVGTVLFLASDLMVFAALFTAWFVLRAANPGEWPPAGAELPVTTAAVATVALVVSSGTLQLGVHAMEHRRDRAALRRWTVVTFVLGALFSLAQLREYAEVGFGISTHAYGSAYVGLTVVHLAHVVFGLGLLAALWFRAGPGRPLPIGDVHATSYVWHLVDLVWIGVFATVYLAP